MAEANTFRFQLLFESPLVRWNGDYNEKRLGLANYEKSRVYLERGEEAGA